MRQLRLPLCVLFLLIFISLSFLSPCPPSSISTPSPVGFTQVLASDSSPSYLSSNDADTFDLDEQELTAEQRRKLFGIEDETNELEAFYQSKMNGGVPVPPSQPQQPKQEQQQPQQQQQRQPESPQPSPTQPPLQPSGSPPPSSPSSLTSPLDFSSDLTFHLPLFRTLFTQLISSSGHWHLSVSASRSSYDKLQRLIRRGEENDMEEMIELGVKILKESQSRKVSEEEYGEGEDWFAAEPNTESNEGETPLWWSRARLHLGHYWRRIAISDVGVAVSNAWQEIGIPQQYDEVALIAAAVILFVSQFTFAFRLGMKRQRELDMNVEDEMLCSSSPSSSSNAAASTNPDNAITTRARPSHIRSSTRSSLSVVKSYESATMTPEEFEKEMNKLKMQKQIQQAKQQLQQAKQEIEQAELENHQTELKRICYNVAMVLIGSILLLFIFGYMSEYRELHEQMKAKLIVAQNRKPPPGCLSIEEEESSNGILQYLSDSWYTITKSANQDRCVEYVQSIHASSSPNVMLVLTSFLSKLAFSPLAIAADNFGLAIRKFLDHHGIFSQLALFGSMIIAIVGSVVVLVMLGQFCWCWPSKRGGGTRRDTGPRERKRQNEANRLRDRDRDRDRDRNGHNLLPSSSSSSYRITHQAEQQWNEVEADAKSSASPPAGSLSPASFSKSKSNSKFAKLASRNSLQEDDERDPPTQSGSSSAVAPHTFSPSSPSTKSRSPLKSPAKVKPSSPVPQSKPQIQAVETRTIVATSSASALTSVDAFGSSIVSAECVVEEEEYEQVEVVDSPTSTISGSSASQTSDAVAESLPSSASFSL